MTKAFTLPFKINLLLIPLFFPRPSPTTTKKKRPVQHAMIFEEWEGKVTGLITKKVEQLKDLIANKFISFNNREDERMTGWLKNFWTRVPTGC